jgi:HAD superfamily hydrolase (TIGR01509 family)
MISFPARRYAGYIFDCDGTLVDSMPLGHAAWRSAIASSGASFDFTWELFLSRGGMGMEETVVELNAQFGESMDPAQVAADQRAYVWANVETVQPIRPVVEFAGRVSRFAPCAVASGSERRIVDRQLEVVKIRDLFAAIVTPEDVERGKPHPDTLLRAAELLGVPARECLVLEDSPLGQQAAFAAGMECLMVAPN